MTSHSDTPFLLAGRMQHRKRHRSRKRATTSYHSTTPNDSTRRSPAQRRGDQGEDRALELLIAHGLHLLAHNLSCPMGEIDLIMRDGKVLVFVEVRARGSDRYGGAAASIGPDKHRRLRHAAQFFLPILARRHWHGQEPVCRFDVVALEASEIHWLRGALTDGESVA